MHSGRREKTKKQDVRAYVWLAPGREEGMVKEQTFLTHSLTFYLSFLYKLNLLTFRSLPCVFRDRQCLMSPNIQCEAS